MNECEYFMQKQIFDINAFDDIRYKFFCFHDSVVKEITLEDCEKCKKLHEPKYNAPSMPLAAPTKQECLYCSADYYQEIICIGKRYHTSFECTSQILPTNFCPVCGKKLNRSKGGLIWNTIK